MSDDKAFEQIAHYVLKHELKFTDFLSLINITQNSNRTDFEAQLVQVLSIDEQDAKALA